MPKVVLDGAVRLQMFYRDTDELELWFDSLKLFQILLTAVQGEG